MDKVNDKMNPPACDDGECVGCEYEEECKDEIYAEPEGYERDWMAWGGTL